MKPHGSLLCPRVLTNCCPDQMNPVIVLNPLHTSTRGFCVALQSLLPYLDLPLPCHPPYYWLRLFSSQTFSYINTPTFSTPVITTFTTPFILHTYPPMKMEQSVPKQWHTKFRRQAITQKKAYNHFFLTIYFRPNLHKVSGEIQIPSPMYKGKTNYLSLVISIV